MKSEGSQFKTDEWVIIKKYNDKWRCRVVSYYQGSSVSLCWDSRNGRYSASCQWEKRSASRWSSLSQGKTVISITLTKKRLRHKFKFRLFPFYWLTLNISSDWKHTLLNDCVLFWCLRLIYFIMQIIVCYMYTRFIFYLCQG